MSFLCENCTANGVDKTQHQEKLSKAKLTIQRLLYQSEQSGTLLLKQDIDKIVDIVISNKDLLSFISECANVSSITIRKNAIVVTKAIAIQLIKLKEKKCEIDYLKRVLLTRLQDRCTQIRRMTAEALFSLPFADVLPRLIEEMQIDPEPEIRQTILQSFASESTKYEFLPTVATAVASRIMDTSNAVRMEAVRLFGNMKLEQIAPNILRRASFFAVNDVAAVKSLFIESLCKMLEKGEEVNLKKYIKILSPALYKEQCKSLIYAVLDYLQCNQESSSQNSQKRPIAFHIPRHMHNEIDSFILMSVCARDKHLYESSLGFPEDKTTFRSANCNFEMVIDSIKKGISENVSLFALENCIELLLISPPLNEKERKSVYDLSIMLLNSSFLITELVNMTAKLLFVASNNSCEFREKTLEIVADLCEPLEDKDYDSLNSENTQRVTYIDQQMEYLENLPSELLTISQVVEYNELKEMNGLLTSQSDLWNFNEPIARALDVLCSVEPTTNSPLSFEISETILTYVGNEFSFVRRRAVKALGEIAVADMNFFVNHILLFVQIAKNDIPSVQIETVKIFSDCYILHQPKDLPFVSIIYEIYRDAVKSFFAEKREYDDVINRTTTTEMEIEDEQDTLWLQQHERRPATENKKKLFSHLAKCSLDFSQETTVNHRTHEMIDLQVALAVVCTEAASKLCFAEDNCGVALLKHILHSQIVAPKLANAGSIVLEKYLENHFKSSINFLEIDFETKLSLINFQEERFEFPIAMCSLLYDWSEDFPSSLQFAFDELILLVFNIAKTKELAEFLSFTFISVLINFGIDQPKQRIIPVSELIEEKGSFRQYRTILLAIRSKQFTFLSKVHREALLKQLVNILQELEKPYTSKRIKSRAMIVTKALKSIEITEHQYSEKEWSPPKPKRTSSAPHQKIKTICESEKHKIAKKPASLVMPEKVKTWIELNKRKFCDIDNFSLECEGQASKKSKKESDETNKPINTSEQPPSPLLCPSPPKSEPLGGRKPSFHENTVLSDKHTAVHRVFFTGFTDDEAQLYKGIVSLLGGKVCDGEFSDEVTHVVWKGRTRTTLTLAAFASGCWVMTTKWLRKSLTEKRFVSEIGYGWKREWGLFVNWRVCLQGLKDDKLISQLVFLGGGKIVDEAQNPTHIITLKKEPNRSELVKTMSVFEFYDFIHPPIYKEG